jgi:hypothetical protein
MRYPAKELKAEAYKAYSKDAFNDEERGVAYFAHGYRYAGKTGEADDILCALIDTTRYIETSLPGVDKIIIMRRLLLSAKEVITSDALIFYPQKRRKRRRYGMNSYNIGLEDRKIIEEMYNAGAKPCEIAARIGKCQATIYREIKRGEVPELNARCRPAYRAEVAEKRVTEAYRKRGRRKATE